MLGRIWSGSSSIIKLYVFFSSDGALWRAGGQRCLHSSKQMLPWSATGIYILHPECGTLRFLSGKSCRFGKDVQGRNSSRKILRVFSPSQRRVPNETPVCTRGGVELRPHTGKVRLRSGFWASCEKRPAPFAGGARAVSVVTGTRVKGGQMIHVVTGVSLFFLCFARCFGRIVCISFFYLMLRPGG